MGAARLRLALPQIREGVESPRETVTRLALAGAGFPEPVVAHDVFQDGRFLGRVDLAYPKFRIAIEYDGKPIGRRSRRSRTSRASTASSRLAGS